MRLTRALISASAALAACADANRATPASDDAAALVERERAAVAQPTLDSAAIAVDTIARGLHVPWGIVPLPDGRLLVTERAGRIRVVDADGLRAEPWAVLPVYADDPRVLPEAGLMGIALAPDFATSGHVYVVGTFLRDPSDTSSALGARVRRRLRARLRDPVSARGLENRVYRLTDRGGRGVAPRVVLDGLLTSHYHAGGALAFAPDETLHLALGDATHPELADTEGLHLACVVRVSTTGSQPDRIRPLRFAGGLRNVQGIAWHPRTGEAFAVDHGPSRMHWEQGRQGFDELNVLREGAWYGWGAQPTTAGRPVVPTPPLSVWPVAIAPAALAFAPPGWGENVLLVTGLRSGALHRLVLARDAGDAWRVTGEERMLEGQGRLRALATDASGAVYVGTSNHDGRGTPRAGDDMLLRVRRR